MNKQLAIYLIAIVALLTVGGLALRIVGNHRSTPDCALTQEEAQLLHGFPGQRRWDMTDQQEPEPIMPGSPQSERP